MSGNKYQQEVDLPALPGVLGLELVRHYNSLDAHRGLTGANWRISYEAVLYDFGRSLQIVQADGRRLMFERPAAQGKTSASATHELCTAADPADGQVRIEQDAQGRASYHWRWSDGRTLVFGQGHNGGHPLQSITAASGEQLTLSYAPSGELVGVRDPQGRTLRLLYDATRQLSAIQTPVNELRYRRDAQYRLIEVSTVAQDKTIATRRYHHEDRSPERPRQRADRRQPDRQRTRKERRAAALHVCVRHAWPRDPQHQGRRHREDRSAIRRAAAAASAQGEQRR